MNKADVAKIAIIFLFLIILFHFLLKKISAMKAMTEIFLMLKLVTIQGGSFCHKDTKSRSFTKKAIIIFMLIHSL